MLGVPWRVLFGGMWPAGCFKFGMFGVLGLMVCKRFPSESVSYGFTGFYVEIG